MNILASLRSFPFSPLAPSTSHPRLLPFAPLMTSVLPPFHFTYVQYTPPTPTRLHCRVVPRRCVLDFRSTDPLHLARGSVRALWSPPAGSGADPQPKSNLVHFSLKTWHLVAAILVSARDAGDFLWRGGWAGDCSKMRESPERCGKLGRSAYGISDTRH